MSAQQHTELLTLSRTDLEQMVKNLAILQIVGGLFVGEFGGQQVRWLDDGGCEVVTSYTRGSLYDVAFPQPKGTPPEKQRRRSRKR